MRHAITPRLSTIDPVQFAEDVETLARQAVSGLLFELGAKAPRWPAESPLKNAVLWLAWYAKTGQGEAEQARLMLQQVEGMLFRRAVDSGSVEAALDYETPIGVVLGAVRARIALAEDTPVPVAELASLAGYAPSMIRGAVKAGVLRRGPPPEQGRAMDAGIVAEDARAWLRDRVPGLGLSRQERFRKAAIEVVADHKEVFEKLAKR